MILVDPTCELKKFEFNLFRGFYEDFISKCGFLFLITFSLQLLSKKFCNFPFFHQNLFACKFLLLILFRKTFHFLQSKVKSLKKVSKNYQPSWKRGVESEWRNSVWSVWQETRMSERGFGKLFGVKLFKAQITTWVSETKIQISKISLKRFSSTLNATSECD